MAAYRTTGRLPAPAQRIVALAPSLTETLFFLGLGSKTIGVTEQCDLPEETALPEKIGSFSRPDIKRICELRADLVLGLDRFHDQFAGELAAAGIAMMLFNYSTVEDIFLGMEEIARAAGVDQAGAPLIQGLRDRVSRVQSTTSGRDHPRVFRLMTDDPIVTPSASCFQTDAIKLAGGRTMELNFAEAYVSVALEEVVGFNPEVIVSCGIEEGQQPRERCRGCRAVTRPCMREVRELAHRTGWSRTSAARCGRIRAMACGLLCHPGPKTVEAIELMAGMFSQGTRGQAALRSDG